MVLVSFLVYQQEHYTTARLLHLELHTQVKTNINLLEQC